MDEKEQEISQELVDENEDVTQEINEDVGEVLSPLEELQGQLKECEDRYLRANADFENIKKRLEKEKYQAVDYANEIFARDLLPIVDALEMAYKSAEDVEDNEVVSKIKEGIALTLEQFKKAFDKHGIKTVEDSGEFDPNIHDAMMRVESDEHKSGQIVQSYQKGYTIKGRVLRPGMVSVAK